MCFVFVVDPQNLALLKSSGIKQQKVGHQIFITNFPFYTRKRSQKVINTVFKVT